MQIQFAFLCGFWYGDCHSADADADADDAAAAIAIAVVVREINWKA